MGLVLTIVGIWCAGSLLAAGLGLAAARGDRNLQWQLEQEDAPTPPPKLELVA